MEGNSYILQKIKFEALTGVAADYKLYALLAPHINNGGANNTASTPSVFGTFFVDIPTSKTTNSAKIDFTFLWSEGNKWEGRNFEVALI